MSFFTLVNATDADASADERSFAGAIRRGGRSTILGKLRGARHLIGDPEKWVKGMVACDAKGEEIHPEEPTAVRWCLEGALRAAGVSTVFAADPAIMLVNMATGVETGKLDDWNDADERVHAEVVDAIDKAIALAEDFNFAPKRSDFPDTWDGGVAFMNASNAFEGPRQLACEKAFHSAWKATMARLDRDAKAGAR